MENVDLQSNSPIDFRSTNLPTKGNSKQFLEFNKQLNNGILDPSSFSKPVSPHPSENIQKLVDAVNSNPHLVIMIKGHPMPIEIKEVPILEANEIRTQIKDPTYQKELLNHQNNKHYSILLRDPNRAESAELVKAKKDLADLQRIQNIYQEGDDPEDSDLMIVNKALEDWGDFSTALMMTEVTVNSIATEQNKPTVSIRVCENGEIGEVASIASHSNQLGGSDLMKGVDSLCHTLGVKKMFLEDDAKIESPSGSYSLRLFRYNTGKSSWYEDAFQFKPYRSSLKGIEEVEISSTSLHSQEIRAFNEASVRELKDWLSNTNIDSSRSNPVLAVLDKANESITLRDLIKQTGDEIIKNKKPLQKDMDLLLGGVLTAFASYSGSDDMLLEKKKQAETLIESRYFCKSYS